MMACPWCGEESVCKYGRNRRGDQVYRCRACTRPSTDRTGTPFAGFPFPSDIIALAMRWQLRSRLSDADTADLLAQRGISVAPSTIDAWGQRITPVQQEAARSKRQPVGRVWSVNETSIRVAGRWPYAYRALELDAQGKVVEVSLDPTRDAEEAERFFRCAAEETGERPTCVPTDKAPC